MNTLDISNLCEYDFAEDREEAKESSDVCSRKEPCLCCMDCLGLSWRDFI